MDAWTGRLTLMRLLAVRAGVGPMVERMCALPASWAISEAAAP